MRTAQLLTAAVTIAIAAGACNRTETRENAREAAADVRAAAAHAGDRIADGWLTTKVQAKFFAHDDVKSRYISVDSRDGVVTLRGFVENDAQRQEVLELARNTDGVTRVDDQLLIGRSPREGFEQPERDTVATTGGADLPDAPAAADVDRDALIVSRIQSRYFLDPQIKRRHVDVQAANGVVTLRGQVAGDNERAQALLLARTAEGVTRVEDSLTIDASLGETAAPLGASGNPAVQPAPAPAAPVPATAAPRANAAPAPNAAGASTGAATGRGTGTGGGAAAIPGKAPGAAEDSTPGGKAPAAGTGGPSSADSALESRVKSAVSGDAQLKGANVEITARDGVVLLQGTVANQAAKQRLLAAVRRAEGVMQVVDRVTVGATGR